MRLTRFFAAVSLMTILAAAGILLARPKSRTAGSQLYPTDFARQRQLPRVMLWAWERPEDLRGIDPREAGVAFLARTVFLTGDGVAVRPRLQPLRVPPGTTVVAVVRVEIGRGTPPTLSPQQRKATAQAIAEAAGTPRLFGLQVDFDATRSERAFYRDLLRDLRAQLPAQMPLSITALASWCLGDNWLAGFPVDDAIPMLFRMGIGEREVELHLKAGGDFRSPVCRQSLGISTDEPLAYLPAGRRLYIFRPRAWTPDFARLTIETVQP